MKFKVLNSTLSCISKCIRFVSTMVSKKIIVGLFCLSFLGACASPTAMLGPAYTLTSSGNIYQAGFTYGSNEMITMYTGKTPLEHLGDITSESLSVKKNIQRKTLESEDFQQLVKNKIKKNKGKIKLSNQ